MDTFKSLNLSEQIMGAIDKLHFVVPTQIQRETIPLILKGQDIIGESATGSGKTLAFGVGIVEKCIPRMGVQAIVLVPTRELAEQVKDEMVKISYKKGIKILAVYGGVSMNPQIDALQKSEVIVATPGRFLDHLDRRSFDMSKVKILVLDEADRMVEMGFIEDVEKIIKACPKNRQTLLFSATMHGIATKIASKYMKEPKIVHATKMVDPTKLKQIYYDVPSKLKKELLVHLLKKEESDLVMVFCNTRRETDIVVDILKINGIKSNAIHGGLSQVKRLKTIEEFHKGKFNVLICTDVAARGLHIEGITHIYNYDIPNEPGEYVHRIGRTARAGRSGLVINVLSNRDYDNFSRVLSEFRDYKIEKVERPFLEPNPQNQIVVNNARGDRNSSRGSPRRGSPRGDRNSSRSAPRGDRSSSRDGRGSSRSSSGPRRDGERSRSPSRTRD